MRKSTDDILKTGEGVQIMKRKTALILLLAALLISTVAAFAGCTDPESGEPMIVDGKTFVYDSVEIELTCDEEEFFEQTGMQFNEEYVERVKKQMQLFFGGTEISFDDGVMHFVYGENFPSESEEDSELYCRYEQNGGEISVIDDIPMFRFLTVSVVGENVILTQIEENGMIIGNLVFAEKQ